MPEKKHIIILVFIFLCFWTLSAHSLSFRIIKIRIPPYTQLFVEGATVKGDFRTGKYKIYLPENFKFPFTIKAIGPMGGTVIKKISSPSELKSLKIREAVIANKKANPKSLATLPLLCPRLKIIEKLSLNNSKNQKIEYEFVYDGALDRMNHIPVFQLLDPDARLGVQYKTFSEIDTKNLLLLKKVEITHDYEDTEIIDYQGPHPIDGSDHIVHEGEGGFYANFHYAIVPYKKNVLNMDRQTLLHFAQGKLKEIDKENLRPEIRTHSFVPGPFLSKTGQLYKLCEWGDTAFQAPVQIMSYTDIALWDWDYSVKNSDHILLIVWEGDEEDWLYKAKLIHPFYLTDDIVGIFEIKRKQTLKPLTLTNKKGDFKITVQTGDLKITPRGK